LQAFTELARIEKKDSRKPSSQIAKEKEKKKEKKRKKQKKRVELSRFLVFLQARRPQRTTAKSSLIGPWQGRVSAAS